MSAQADAQADFAALKARWVLAVNALGYRVREGEGVLLQKRVGTGTPDGRNERQHVYDAVHRPRSLHYIEWGGTACDIQLDRWCAPSVGLPAGYWQWVGSLPREQQGEAWRVPAEMWKALDPRCRSGLDFGDLNHISLAWASDGRALAEPVEDAGC